LSRRFADCIPTHRRVNPDAFTGDSEFSSKVCTSNSRQNVRMRLSWNSSCCISFFNGGRCSADQQRWLAFTGSCLEKLDNYCGVVHKSRTRQARLQPTPRCRSDGSVAVGKQTIAAELMPFEQLSKYQRASNLRMSWMGAG
jgi:hypothetical protein